MDNDLCIYSYNSRGFDSTKQDIIKNLLLLSGDILPVICNQENFLLKANGYIIENCLPDHKIFFKPATKKGLSGRPKNGMFIALPISMKDSVQDVSPLSSRIQCILIQTQNGKVMVLNTYFPTDPRCNNFDDSELLLTLSSIKEVIGSHDFDRLIWAGDIDADFDRNTKCVHLVNEFIYEMNLSKSWDRYEIDFTHVFEVDDVTHVSTIDHFFWNSSNDNCVIDSGVLHFPDNLSDHAPIYCKMKIGIVSKQSSHASLPPKNKNPCWKLASDSQKLEYYNELQSRLLRLNVPSCISDCTNVNCKDETHNRELDNMMLEVLESLECAADIQIPKPKSANKNSSAKATILNWKEIAPYKEQAYFWHSVWLSAGKPLNNNLHMIMKRSRNAYHLKIRKNKRILDRIKKDSMLKACLDSNGNIFTEIKKQRKCSRINATTIDGHSNNIESHFAQKYKKLYNSVNDEENLFKTEEMLESKINQTNSYNETNIITAELLCVASQKLKSGKSDPILNVTSDFFLNAPPILYEMLAKILRGYITHAYVSDFLLLSMLIPIVKDKLGDATHSNNYRSIAISSLVMKIFDWVIILAFSKYLNFDDLQFGYQANVSASMCTWTAVETISYFARNGSDVFTCLMDMSKAFDTVKHSVLFRKLLEQGLPFIIIRFILISYRRQKANVKWNKELSEFFNIENGVKQGAVLSAIFYCMYTNGLFQELRRQNIGCRIGLDYVGVVGFADDLFLMCPTFDGLQKMLVVCEKYASTHNLSFSTDPNPNKSKTKCMAFLLKKRNLANLSLCGNKLPWVNVGKHLGTKLENKLEGIVTQDVKEKRAQYIQRNNELMQEFSYAHSTTKTKINNIYNSHFTGSVLWDLFGKEVEMIFNTWNTSIRRMFRVDRTTHRYFIEPLSRTPHIKIQLLKRFINFTKKLLSSGKSAPKTLLDKIKHDCRSTTGRNLRNIMKFCGSRDILEITTQEIAGKSYHPIPINEIWRLDIVKELLEIRDDKYELDGWKKEEVNDCIQSLTST